MCEDWVPTIVLRSTLAGDTRLGAEQNVPTTKKGLRDKKQI